jgi:hypothetical protein
MHLLLWAKTPCPFQPQLYSFRYEGCIVDLKSLAMQMEDDLIVLMWAVVEAAHRSSQDKV